MRPIMRPQSLQRYCMCYHWQSEALSVAGYTGIKSVTHLLGNPNTCYLTDWLEASHIFIMSKPINTAVMIQCHPWPSNYPAWAVWLYVNTPLSRRLIYCWCYTVVWRYVKNYSPEVPGLLRTVSIWFHFFSPAAVCSMLSCFLQFLCKRKKKKKRKRHLCKGCSFFVAGLH